MSKLLQEYFKSKCIRKVFKSDALSLDGIPMKEVKSTVSTSEEHVFLETMLLEDQEVVSFMDMLMLTTRKT